MQVCVQIYVVWDYASRELEETAVHIGTTIHCNNWINCQVGKSLLHSPFHARVTAVCMWLSLQASLVVCFL